MPYTRSRLRQAAEDAASSTAPAARARGWSRSRRQTSAASPASSRWTKLRRQRRKRRRRRARRARHRRRARSRVLRCSPSTSGRRCGQKRSQPAARRRGRPRRLAPERFRGPDDAQAPTDDARSTSSRRSGGDETHGSKSRIACSARERERAHPAGAGGVRRPWSGLLDDALVPRCGRTIVAYGSCRRRRSSSAVQRPRAPRCSRNRSPCRARGGTGSLGRRQRSIRRSASSHAWTS